MDLAERIAWHMVGPGVAQVVARAIAQSTRLAGVDRPCAQLAQRTAPIELSVGRHRLLRYSWLRVGLRVSCVRCHRLSARHRRGVASMKRILDAIAIWYGDWRFNRMMRVWDKDKFR